MWELWEGRGSGNKKWDCIIGNGWQREGNRLITDAFEGGSVQSFEIEGIRGGKMNCSRTGTTL